MGPKREVVEVTEQHQIISYDQPVKVEIGTTASGKVTVSVRKYCKDLNELDNVIEIYKQARRDLGIDV